MPVLRTTVFRNAICHRFGGRGQPKSLVSSLSFPRLKLKSEALLCWYKETRLRCLRFSVEDSLHTTKAEVRYFFFTMIRHISACISKFARCHFTCKVNTYAILVKFCHTTEVFSWLGTDESDNTASPKCSGCGSASPQSEGLNSSCWTRIFEY